MVRTLGEAARVSPLHARFVAVALQEFMASPVLATRDLAGLLDLLHEVLVGLGEAMTVAGSAEFLGSIQGTGKAARLARTLVGLAGNPRATPRLMAVTRASAGRIERAEPWQRCCPATARETHTEPIQTGC